MICFKPQNSEENPLILFNNQQQFANANRSRPLPFDSLSLQQQQPHQPQPPQNQQQLQQQLNNKPKLFSRQSVLKEEEDKVIDQLRQNELLQRRSYADFNANQPQYQNLDPYSHYGQQIAFTLNNYRSPMNKPNYSLDSKPFCFFCSHSEKNLKIVRLESDHPIFFHKKSPF
jgi:hypothetical protein